MPWLRSRGPASARKVWKAGEIFCSGDGMVSRTVAGRAPLAWCGSGDLYPLPHLYQDFAHGAFGEAVEGLLRFGEVEDVVDDRALSGGFEALDDLVPGFACGFGCVVGDGDAADAVAAEE